MGGPAAAWLARWEGFRESKLRLDGGLSELSEDELVAFIRRPETLRSQQQAVYVMLGGRISQGHAPQNRPPSCCFRCCSFCCCCCFRCVVSAASVAFAAAYAS